MQQKWQTQNSTQSDTEAANTIDGFSAQNDSLTVVLNRKHTLYSKRWLNGSVMVSSKVLVTNVTTSLQLYFQFSFLSPPPLIVRINKVFFTNNLLNSLWHPNLENTMTSKWTWYAKLLPMSQPNGWILWRIWQTVNISLQRTRQYLTGTDFSRQISFHLNTETK